MKNNLGFTENFGGNNYLIFYDDSVDEHMQRFTLAHEIGHILADAFYSPTDSPKKIEEAERAANLAIQTYIYT